MVKIDIQQLKQATNLVDLAARSTELHKESAKEFAGPCPKCGGHDRFHVTVDWFFCRQCHEKRGDPIEYMRWLQGVGFQEACTLLNSGLYAPAAPSAPAPREPQPKPPVTTNWRQDTYEALVTQAHERLFH